jgi:hypothetical protein
MSFSARTRPAASMRTATTIRSFAPFGTVPHNWHAVLTTLLIPT